MPMTEPSPPFEVDHIVNKRNEIKQKVVLRVSFSSEARTWDRDAANQIKATTLKIMDCLGVERKTVDPVVKGVLQEVDPAKTRAL